MVGTIDLGSGALSAAGVQDARKITEPTVESQKKARENRVFWGLTQLTGSLYASLAGCVYKCRVASFRESFG